MMNSMVKVNRIISDEVTTTFSDLAFGAWFSESSKEGPILLKIGYEINNNTLMPIVDGGDSLILSTRKAQRVFICDVKIDWKRR